MMDSTKIKRVIGLGVLIAVAALAGGSSVAARSGGNTPDLPSPLCDGVQVPTGNKLAFRLYAVGVQVYRWNGTSWTFVEPVAQLFSDSNYNVKVGTHYAGPTWESNNGSKVVGRREADCTPDPTAIPWLLLEKVSTDGVGIFTPVTFIQRVNTKGGLAPSAPGTSIGAVAQVPYSTEYYFYYAK
jgi:hypothetical protein